MAVDVIATRGVGDRTAVILIYFFWNIPVYDEGFPVKLERLQAELS